MGYAGNHIMLTRLSRWRLSCHRSVTSLQTSPSRIRVTMRLRMMQLRWVRVEKCFKKALLNSQRWSEELCNLRMCWFALGTFLWTTFDGKVLHQLDAEDLLLRAQSSRTIYGVVSSKMQAKLNKQSLVQPRIQVVVTHRWRALHLHTCSILSLTDGNDPLHKRNRYGRSIGLFKIMLIKMVSVIRSIAFYV